MKLFFQGDHFKILQLTDAHLKDGGEKDARALALIRAAVEQVRPDLIALTGDITTFERNEEMMEILLETMNGLKTPWSMVFGNHDTERGKVDRATLARMIRTSPYAYFDEGPAEVDGVGNYRVTVCDGELGSWSLFFLDSHHYKMYDGERAYDYLHRNQIDWFVKKNREAGRLPALCFFHIPLPEYQEVWQRGGCVGVQNEAPCPPRNNSGMFTAMMEEGNVRGVFTGHDHVNDYFGTLWGIKLCYGRVTGFNSYGEDFPHGAKVITLRKDGAFSLDTYLEDGTMHKNFDFE